MAKRLLVLALAVLMVATGCTASVDDIAVEDAIVDTDDTSSQEPADADPAENEADSDLAGDETSNDDDADAEPSVPASDFSVLAALASIPESVTVEARGSLQVSVGDIDAAADQARLRRPLDSANSDDLVEFFGPLTGFAVNDRPLRVFVPVPRLFQDRTIAFIDEFVDELGFSPGDVTTFVALESAPAEFVVLEGVTGPADLPEVAPGVFTVGEGADLEFSVDEVSPARPLGRPLRLSQQDDQLALSLSTTAMVDWIDGTGPTLADNVALSAVAARLDEEQVVSAFLITQEASYRSVGLGWRADDRGRRGVIVLSYDSEEAASAALQTAMASLAGESLISQQPISELVTVEQAEARGTEVVLVVEFADERPPSVIFNMLIQGDHPFADS